MIPKRYSSSFFYGAILDRSIYRHAAVDSIFIDFYPLVCNTLNGYDSIIIDGLPVSVESILFSLVKDLVLVIVAYD